MTQTIDLTAAAANRIARSLPPMIEQVACVAYEAQRGLALSSGTVDLPTWQVAPARIKAVVRLCVQAALEGEQNPKTLHDHWRTRWEGEGWKWGPEFSHASMTHPMLRAFEELTKAERFQYKLLICVARAFVIG
ncbi:MAG TPA: RyR domain-containing protein [Verrucomicrobiae bacterium]|jgi:hypothetical protein|nr:RyR domain-containing protein [Verrucomicrobiae bacterium]